jgi:hypothetical protein
MLILKSNPAGLAVVEVFLRNRGWKLHSTSDLKEALAHLLKHKPTYVLLSVDHSNKNVLQLSKLLGPDYPGVVMPFAESQSSVSFNLLNSIESDYRIYPPATGPAIERCVHRYLKDLEDHPEKVGPLRTMSAEESSLYSIKGSGLNHSGAQVEKGRSQWGPVISSESRNARGTATSTSSEDHEISKRAGSSTEHENPRISVSTTGQGTSQTPASLLERGHARNSQSLKRRDTSQSSESLMARAAGKSLEEASQSGDGQVRDRIHQHTNAACIVIESQRFSGYLVAVMGKDKVINEDFIASVKEKLFKFLVDQGEDISHDEALSLKIKQVEFEPWAIEYADFLRKSVHKGDEVAMAFFPRKPLKATLEVSAREDMVKIGLEDLHGDRVVDFDLFMFLPTNNKYLLYTPKGGVFYDRQLERLKKQGVTHMHIDKVAAPAISKYRAENYLNDLVDDFADAGAKDAVHEVEASAGAKTEEVA